VAGRLPAEECTATTETQRSRRSGPSHAVSPVQRAAARRRAAATKTEHLNIASCSTCSKCDGPQPLFSVEAALSALRSCSASRSYLLAWTTACCLLAEYEGAVCPSLARMLEERALALAEERRSSSEKVSAKACAFCLLLRARSERRIGHSCAPCAWPACASRGRSSSQLYGGAWRAPSPGACRTAPLPPPRTSLCAAWWRARWAGRRATRRAPSKQARVPSFISQSRALTPRRRRHGAGRLSLGECLERSLLRTRSRAVRRRATRLAQQAAPASVASRAASWTRLKLRRC